jgi:ubiquinol-cytochrome c reductase cytochrome b subunit
VTGAITFLVAIGAAFTGYLSQQNFDSQWIASEGKDGLNSIGIGSFFNVADFGQMYTWHVILLPVVVAVLVAAHVLLVRRTGVVPPYPARVAKGNGEGSP